MKYILHIITLSLCISSCTQTQKNKVEDFVNNSAELNKPELNQLVTDDFSYVYKNKKSR